MSDIVFDFKFVETRSLGKESLRLVEVADHDQNETDESEEYAKNDGGNSAARSISAVAPLIVAGIDRRYLNRSPDVNLPVGTLGVTMMI